MSVSKIINEFAKAEKIKLKKILVSGFDVGYKIAKSDIFKILEFMRGNKNLRFSVLTDLFCADFPDRKNRFEIVYSLLSLQLNKRCVLKIEIGEAELTPSITALHNSACWYEREIFDMFGVSFDGNPDMRRILTDYGFVGHPLRKDFPLSGHLQVKYDEKLEKVIYEKVSLDQEFRDFDFVSPWNGPSEYKLPGDEKAN